MIGMLLDLVVLIAVCIGISKLMKKSSKWLGGPWGLLLYGLMYIIAGFISNKDYAVVLGLVILFIDAIWGLQKWNERRILKKALRG
jgi:hypothetical protein